MPQSGTMKYRIDVASTTFRAARASYWYCRAPVSPGDSTCETERCPNPVGLWHCRLLCGVLCFQDRNASQQATQQVGSGDDAPLRAPHQDQIVVDDIVLGPLLHDLQAPDDLAEPRLHIPHDDRPVPARALILIGLIEQRVAQKMMGVQHERRLTVEIGHDDPLLAGSVDPLKERIVR